MSIENSAVSAINRRKFLVGAAATGAGFVLSTQLSTGYAETDKEWAPNAFIRINQNSEVTLIIKHIEFGQGTYTGLATLIAEELDADWNQVVCEHAPADASKYNNLHWGKSQGTGGSSAIANSFMQMREAGGVARAMLVAAAAEKWRVSEKDIQVQKGVIVHKKSNRKASFGELASLAAKQAVPEKVVLKDPKDFTLIGTKLPRKDTGKTDGTAIFTQDVKLPNMLTALVAHPPKFGAKLKSYDAKSANKIAGVVAIVEIENGVAVLAKTFWQAKMARDQLQLKWDESQAFNKSSKELMAEYAALAEKPGDVAKAEGDVDSAFKKAHKVFESSYEFPYLPHATMEPMNCVVQVNRSSGNKGAIVGAQFWYGCQGPTMDQAAVANYLGISPGKVEITTVFAGGSFGRRVSTNADYVLEATQIAKNYPKSVPIKLVWDREDDMRAGYYRPMYFHKLKAGVDKKGKIIAWQHHIVGQSIAKGTALAGMIKNNVDPTSVEGATNLPYSIANLKVESTMTDVAVPVLWWRSVGSTHTAYSTEVFIDEIARSLKQDPLQYRLNMLGDDSRYRGVLELVAEKSQWSKKSKSKNSLMGIAVHKSFGTYVAEVVETEKNSAGYKVNKVTCAVDCGVAVNPDIIKAQMEGGIGYGLSPAMYSTLTFENGQVLETNFHAHQVIRLRDMPEIDVHIVPSAEAPTGVGEPATPVIAPALANAIANEDPQAVFTQPINVKFV